MSIWGWKFQNTIPPTVFIQCQSNFMRSLATMGEYRLLLFLAISQIKKNVSLWNFNMGVNGKIMKCAIFWKWQTVQTDENFGLMVPETMCRPLFRSYPLSSVWGHSVHFAKFPMLRLSRNYCSHCFLPSPNLTESIYSEKYRLLLFLATVNSLMFAGINVCVFVTKPCSWGLMFAVSSGLVSYLGT